MKPPTKKEEASLLPASPLTDNDNSTKPTLPAKHIKLTPEGINQSDIDAVLKRYGKMKKRLCEDIVYMGGKLAKMKKQLRHGQWGAWVDRTFPFSIRTATTWIQAWEGSESELALNDPDAYMSLLWGNTSKSLKAVTPIQGPKKKDEDDEQSGGEGFGPGLGEPSIFADKGKPGFYSFKQITAMLDREFFQSGSITVQAKTQFALQLINWLEARKKNLGS